MCRKKDMPKEPGSGIICIKFQGRTNTFILNGDFADEDHSGVRCKKAGVLREAGCCRS